MPLSAIQAHVVGFFLHMQQRETSHSRTLRRGQSLLGREEDVRESGLALPSVSMNHHPFPDRKWGCLEDLGPSSPRMVYCYIITIWVPTFLMRQCGGLWCHSYLSSNPLAWDRHIPEQQHAWREKMSLLSLILTLMASVCFLLKLCVGHSNKVSWCPRLIGQCFE